MTPASRSHLSRLGGLTRAAKYDGITVTRTARGTFAASFLNGHGCSICPSIEIPVDLAPTERERRAAVLRRLHFTRIASLPRSRRQKAAGPADSAGPADTEDHAHDPAAA